MFRQESVKKKTNKKVKKQKNILKNEKTQNVLVENVPQTGTEKSKKELKTKRVDSKPHIQAKTAPLVTKASVLESKREEKNNESIEKDDKSLNDIDKNKSLDDENSPDLGVEKHKNESDSDESRKNIDRKINNIHTNGFKLHDGYFDTEISWIKFTKSSIIEFLLATHDIFVLMHIFS